jgi:hypothetical protein
MVEIFDSTQTRDRKEKRKKSMVLLCRWLGRRDNVVGIKKNKET